ncbi:MAG: TatD family deoxyribonuclease [Chlamydiae bacterium]|nr:TatD family deoxyribonuclease [Chlamydiota bacterium]
MLIDSHAHLTSPQVYPKVDEVLERARMSGVSHILNICTNSEELEKGFILQSRFPFIKNAGATTPHDVEKEGEEAFSVFEAAAKERKLMAIGEAGLDYHYEHSSKKIQQRFLRKYLQLASETNLPIIFHCREAFQDLFSIAEDYPGKAVLHCFTGTVQEAEEVLKRGWYLSLSGIVTFKKSEQLREVAKMAPLTHLLIETDTPYLAPQSHRGEENEPAFLPETAKCIAMAQNISLEELALATTSNAKKLFRF